MQLKSAMTFIKCFNYLRILCGIWGNSCRRRAIILTRSIKKIPTALLSSGLVMSQYSTGETASWSPDHNKRAGSAVTILWRISSPFRRCCDKSFLEAAILVSVFSVDSNFDMHWAPSFRLLKSSFNIRWIVHRPFPMKSNVSNSIQTISVDVVFNLPNWRRIQCWFSFTSAIDGYLYCLALLWSVGVSWKLELQQLLTSPASVFNLMSSRDLRRT